MAKLLFFVNNVVKVVNSVISNFVCRKKNMIFEAVCHTKYREFFRDFVVNVVQNVVNNFFNL